MDIEMNAISKRVGCPLCGFLFGKLEAACGGCILSKRCGMTRCPNCYYEFVEESKFFNSVRRLELISKSPRQRNAGFLSETRKMSRKLGGVAIATLTSFLRNLTRS